MTQQEEIDRLMDECGLTYQEAKRATFGWPGYCRSKLNVTDEDRKVIKEWLESLPEPEASNPFYQFYWGLK